MKILFATSEAFPFATTGGLGDVAYALPKALRKHLVGARVVMPLYASIPNELRENMTFINNITVPVAWREQYCGIFESKYNGVNYILIDNEYYFGRKEIYGEYDDAERFAFFSRAVLEIIPHIDFTPDIIHCNDWQTALTPVYYQFYYYNKPGYEKIKTILTIHNIGYQGQYGKELITDVLGVPPWADSLMEYDGCVNILKAGIETANQVTTVSKTYATEILDPWYSHGLDNILKERSFKLSGILNGIDYELYNPQTDQYLIKNYELKSLEGKQENKKALTEKFCLPYKADVPLVAMCTRLVEHKGLDLVMGIFHDLMKLNVQLVVLGSGDAEYEEFFIEMTHTYPEKFSFKTGFIPALAHQIYGGSDFFLMPSKSEPCGLAQMVSQRYGTIPIVRETGGLADTVIDAGDTGGCGFTFKSYNAHDMLHAIDRGIEQYKDKEKFGELVTCAMELDNSWAKSASEYVKLYKKTILS